MADGILGREAFLAARTDLPRERVDVPELGGVVLVQGLTGKQRDQYEASCVVQKGNKRTFNLIDARAKLVALSVVGEDGKRLFREEDLPALSAMPAQILDRIFSVAQRLSGISDQDVDELGQLFGDDPDGSSPSGSPASSAD
ncbi:MAG: hypothetical protein A3J29_06180 [Acidobacteria bacterium RIFCSPLOWO2_12_FULL_67_14b]|nr:MAG: hypothetical protein A3J29_06180 [Acidobacteria bacterium RIFCSPLOWO2_12_FULL_67_14b]